MKHLGCDHEHRKRPPRIHRALLRLLAQAPVTRKAHGGARLLRHAATYQRLAVAYCNGPEHLNERNPFATIAAKSATAQKAHAAYEAERSKAINAWEDRLARDTERCALRIKDICAPFKLPVTLGGDPRGYCVKVKLPDGSHNTWGGSEDGIGVPA